VIKLCNSGADKELPSPIFKLCTCSFDVEFDYQAEAQNLSLIHNAIMPKWGSLVKVR
jgi:hypothetical protein